MARLDRRVRIRIISSTAGTLDLGQLWAERLDRFLEAETVNVALGQQETTLTTDEQWRIRYDHLVNDAWQRPLANRETRTIAVNPIDPLTGTEQAALGVTSVQEEGRAQFQVLSCSRSSAP